MSKLSLRQKALFLVDNPRKFGFSWWFFFAGVVAAYAMWTIYGDNNFIVTVAEKYITIFGLILFGLPRRWVENGITKGIISRNSNWLYLVLPLGYAFSFFPAMWFGHMFFAIIFS